MRWCGGRRRAAAACRRPPGRRPRSGWPPSSAWGGCSRLSAMSSMPTTLISSGHPDPERSQALDAGRSPSGRCRRARRWRRCGGPARPRPMPPSSVGGLGPSTVRLGVRRPGRPSVAARRISRLVQEPRGPPSRAMSRWPRPTRCSTASRAPWRHVHDDGRQAGDRPVDDDQRHLAAELLDQAVAHPRAAQQDAVDLLGQRLDQLLLDARRPRWCRRRRRGSRGCRAWLSAALISGGKNGLAMSATIRPMLCVRPVISARAARLGR